MSSTRRRAVLACIVLGYLAIAVLFAANTPAWQAPDEPAHYNYVRHLAQTGQFPVLQMGDYPHAYLEEIKSRGFPPDLPIDPIRYEFHQPPLYYVLAAPVFSLTGGDLLFLRLLSVVLGAGLVLIAYSIARRVVPASPAVALGAAAFVAFLPQHLATVAQVGNDALAELLLALVLLQLVVWVARPAGAGVPRPATWLRLGVLLGLIAITKTTAYIAIPLAAGAALWLWRRSAASARRIAVEAACLVLPAALIAAPWAARNALVYGWPDLLGLIRHDQIVVGQMRAADFVAQQGWSAYWQRAVTWTFQSFWGVFGWMGVWLDSRVYDGLAILSAIALGGLLVLVVRRPVVGRAARSAPDSVAHPVGSCCLPVLVLLAASVVLTAAAYAWYNSQFLQHQGRYLFTALIPLAVAYAAGWASALRPPGARLVAGLLLAAAAVLAVWGLAGGRGLPEWRLATLAAFAGVLVSSDFVHRAPDLPAVRYARAALSALPFAVLPLLSLYALFGAIVPQLTR